VDNNRVSASDLLDEMEDPDSMPVDQSTGTDDDATLDEMLNEKGPDATTPDIQGAMTESAEGVSQEQADEGITAESAEEVTGTAISQSEQMFKSEEAVMQDKKMTKEQIQKDVELLYAEGKKYYDVEDYEGAAEIWGRIITNFPTASGLFTIRYSIANAYEFSRQYDKAIQQYQKVLAEKPKEEIAVEAAYRLGGCYGKLEKWQYAMEVYKDIIRKQGMSNARSSRAYFNMALVYMKQGKFKRAETIYRNIIRYYPNTASEIQGRFNLASLLTQTKRYKNAVNEYKLINYKFKNTDWAPMAAMHIGDTYKLSGDYKNARDAYSRVLYEYYNNERYVNQAETALENLKHARQFAEKYGEENFEQTRDYTISYKGLSFRTSGKEAGFNYNPSSDMINDNAPIRVKANNED
ncbi:MAG: tetratricopeptide repeat protein, partial [Candidatus Goldbacteria bacterium]|nr:tetratricopeptide repeat protein [Candidatus Goldiibacteriota bacterium]